MPVVVIAKPVDEFEAWIQKTASAQAAAKAEEQKLLDMKMPMDELMALGEEVYVARCAACHMANGQGIPGVFPAVAKADIAVNPSRKLEHVDTVVNGRKGTAMQAFGNQLSLKELAAVITYQRNAWGNNTGEAVQAAQINAVLNGQEL